MSQICTGCYTGDVRALKIRYHVNQRGLRKPPREPCQPTRTMKTAKGTISINEDYENRQGNHVNQRGLRKPPRVPCQPTRTTKTAKGTMSTNENYENRQSNIPCNQGKTPARTPKIKARTLPTSVLFRSLKATAKCVLLD